MGDYHKKEQVTRHPNFVLADALHEAGVALIRAAADASARVAVTDRPEHVPLDALLRAARSAGEALIALTAYTRGLSTAVAKESTSPCHDGPLERTTDREEGAPMK